MAAHSLCFLTSCEIQGIRAVRLSATGKGWNGMQGGATGSARGKGCWNGARSHLAISVEEEGARFEDDLLVVLAQSVGVPLMLLDDGNAVADVLLTLLLERGRGGRGLGGRRQQPRSAG